MTFGLFFIGVNILIGSWLISGAILKVEQRLWDILIVVKENFSKNKNG